MKRGILLIMVLNLFFSCKKTHEKPEAFIVKTTTSSRYVCVPQVTDAEWYKKDNIAPLLEGYETLFKESWKHADFEL